MFKKADDDDYYIVVYILQIYFTDMLCLQSKAFPTACTSALMHSHTHA